MTHPCGNFVSAITNKTIKNFPILAKLERILYMVAELVEVLRAVSFFYYHAVPESAVPEPVEG
jgi:hypothetical protein